MSNKIRIMVAGLPGKMAELVAEEVLNADDMDLVPVALGEVSETVRVGGMRNRYVKIEPLDKHEVAIDARFLDIIVDFTAPDAVNRNAEMYCRNNVPFVMGTTGGDRNLLEKTIMNSGISAVIATNMAKQIVVFQAMMEFAAKTFPDSFKGYTLQIEESHQHGKKDTSGTAKTMVQYFNKLGIPFTVDRISMERNPEVQKKLWGVPEEHLKGHGYHTYTLSSPDETVLLQFRHNVNGRNVYVEGVIDAIRFLAKHREEKGKVFTMIDVLKG